MAESKAPPGDAIIMVADRCDTRKPELNEMTGFSYVWKEVIHRIIKYCG